MMAFMAQPDPPILVVDDDPKIVALVRTRTTSSAGEKGLGR